MSTWYRAFATLLAAAAAGFLLWLAAQFDRGTTGGYWAALGVVAGAGLVLGLASLRGAGGHPPAMLGLVFGPAFLCASWVMLFAQPRAEWGRVQISRWSGDIGIRGVVHDVATWYGVVAFGLGLVLAYVLEPGMAARRRVVVTPAEPAPAPAFEPMDRVIADEPTTAERAEAAAEPAAVTRRRWRGRVRVR